MPPPARGGTAGSVLSKCGGARLPTTTVSQSFNYCFNLMQRSRIQLPNGLQAFCDGLTVAVLLNS